LSLLRETNRPFSPFLPGILLSIHSLLLARASWQTLCLASFTQPSWLDPSPIEYRYPWPIRLVVCDYPRPHGRQRKGKNTTAPLSRHPFPFPRAGFLLHYCPTYLCVYLATHPSNCCSFLGFHLAFSLPIVESPTPRIGRRTLKQLPFHTPCTCPAVACLLLLAGLLCNNISDRAFTLQHLLPPPTTNCPLTTH